MLEFVSVHPDFEGAELQSKDFSKGEFNYLTNFYYKTAWDKYMRYFPPGFLFRIISFYVMERMRKGIKLPLESFVSTEVKKYPKWKIKNATHDWNKVCCMHCRTTLIYSWILLSTSNELAMQFPAENIMIINSEEFHVVSLILYICPWRVPWLHGCDRNARNVVKYVGLLQ